jgi:hypothetical protein
MVFGVVHVTSPTQPIAFTLSYLMTRLVLSGGRTRMSHATGLDAMGII